MIYTHETFEYIKSHQSNLHYEIIFTRQLRALQFSLLIHDTAVLHLEGIMRNVLQASLVGFTSVKDSVRERFNEA